MYLLFHLVYLSILLCSPRRSVLQVYTSGVASRVFISIGDLNQVEKLAEPLNQENAGIIAIMKPQVLFALSLSNTLLCSLKIFMKMSIKVRELYLF